MKTVGNIVNEAIKVYAIFFPFSCYLIFINLLSSFVILLTHKSLGYPITSIQFYKQFKLDT